MSNISAEQRFELLTKLGANAEWDALTRDEVQLGIKEAERAGAEFTKFVKNGCQLALVVRPGNWPVWQKLMIGGKSREDLLAALKKGGFTVSDWAKDIMGKDAFTTLPKPKEIEFVRVKVGDLGFTNSNRLPTTTEIFTRAKELGLSLCPTEVGPHLRLSMKDEPEGDIFWVAMEPIVGSGGNPNVFYLRRDRGGRWLRASYALPGDRWFLGDGVVFSLGK